MSTSKTAPVKVCPIDISAHRSILEKFIRKFALVNSFKLGEISGGEGIKSYSPDPGQMRKHSDLARRSIEARVKGYFSTGNLDMVGYMEFISNLQIKSRELDRMIDEQLKLSKSVSKAEMDRARADQDKYSTYGKIASGVKFGATVTLAGLGVFAGGVVAAGVGLAYTASNDVIKVVASPKQADIYAFKDTGREIVWTGKNKLAETAFAKVLTEKGKSVFGNVLSSPMAIVSALFAGKELQSDLKSFD